VREKRQGMNVATKVIVIADGAKNCWQATSVLKKSCAEVEYILDWFHIAKKFQPLFNMTSIPEDNIKKIEQIKWGIWHGKHDKAISNLRELTNNKTFDEYFKLNGILIYIPFVMHSFHFGIKAVFFLV
jgi:hypothetical protein